MILSEAKAQALTVVAGVLLILALVGWGACVYQWLKNDTLVAELKAANKDVDTYATDAQAAANAAREWKDAFVNLEKRTAGERATRDALLAVAVQNAKRAQTRADTAAAELADWEQRYANASPACAALLDTPLSVCAELQRGEP